MLVPMVLGPAEVPKVRDPKVARATPELAMLSLMSHARAPEATEIGAALWEGTEALDAERRARYRDMAASLLSKAVLAAMEKKLMSNYQWRTEIGKTSYAKGRAEGEAKAARQVLLDILGGRELPVSAQQRARIAGCTDPEVLQAWAVKAALVRTVDEIFE